MAHRKDHLCDVTSHCWKVRCTVSLLWVHDELTTFLGESHSIASEHLVSFLEVNFDVEGFLSVDSVLTTKSIHVSRFVIDVCSALAASITVAVYTI